MVTFSSLIESTSEALISLHAASGIPWYLFIPGIAATLVVSLRLPFRSYERRFANREKRLSDLRLAWYQKAVQLKLDNPQKRAQQEYKRLRKEAGLTMFKPLVGTLVVYMPAWLIFSRSLWNIAGVGRAAPMDPTLATEGILWFQDLTVADPTYILPVLISASFIYNNFPRSMVEARQLLDPKQTSMAVRLRRGGLVLAPVLAVILSGLPSGVTFFWLSSSLILRGSTALKDRSLPPPSKNPWLNSTGATREQWWVAGPK